MFNKRFYKLQCWSSSVKPRETLTYRLLLLPSLAVMTAILGFPVIYSIVTSLTDLKLVGPSQTGNFVGVANFVDALRNPEFRNAVVVTMKLTVLCVGCEFLLGFALALVLNKDLKGFRIFRTLFLLPMMIAPIVAGLMWLLMYKPRIGVINVVMKNIVGFRKLPVWLGDLHTALYAVALVDIWQWTPFVVLMLLAALHAIPHEQYEAGQIDGANSLQVLRFITIPAIIPTMLVVLLIRGMEIFQIFDIIFMLTRGGPSNATESLVFYSFRYAFHTFEMGYAGAVSLIMLAIMMVLSLVLIKLIQRESQ